MSGHLSISCPKCNHRLRVRKQYVGQHVVCRYCKHGFKVEPVGGQLESSSAQRAEAAGALPEGDPLQGGPETRPAELECLRLELRDAREAAVQLQNRATELEEQLARSSAANQAELQRLAEVVGGHETTVQQLETDLVEMRRLLAAKESELEDMAMSRSQLQTRYDELANYAASLEGQPSGQDTATAEHGESSQAIERLTRELDQAREQIEQLRTVMFNMGISV